MAADVAPGRRPGGGAVSGRAHALYLGAIAVLVLVLVCVGARAARAARVLREAQERFGLGGAGPARSAVPRRAPLREATGAELLRPRTFEEYRAEVDGLVARALELGDLGPPGKLADACALALRGGKRLRPIILLEVCRAATVAGGGRGPPVDPADAALFVEYLHASSLVVDDLPAFDDDAERRGAPAVHAAAGPAVAQMAALSLLAGAFQNICRQVDWLRENCPEAGNVDALGTRLCHDVSAAIGAMGAAGGQLMDSALSEAELFAAHGSGAVLEIMRLKTATFYEIAFLAGWLVAGGDAAGAEDLRRAGQRFGTAFQVADDIGDAAQDAARRAAGKPGWNFANHYGEGEARAWVARELAACRAALEARGLFTPLWEEIYGKVWAMAGGGPP